MKKPELVVNAKNPDEAKAFFEAGADAVVIGDQRFMLTNIGSFTPRQMKEMVEFGHSLNKKVYFLVDAVMTNDLIDEFSLFLPEIIDVGFDGIRFWDLGVYQLLKNIDHAPPMHLIDQMMLTNYGTLNYWNEKRVSRGRLAHELTLNELIEIKHNVAIEVEILAHGAPLMFTSRRRLLDNYIEFQKTFGEEIKVTGDDDFLYDEERDLKYPMIQNAHGTHIFGGTDVCMIDDLDKIFHFNALYLESFTYNNSDFLKIIETYRFSINLLSESLEKYAQARRPLFKAVEKYQPSNRKLDAGFNYKPTIYKNKQEE